MTTDLIRYDLLVQDALRSVVRDVLTDASKNGLPGDHHFFITFRTDAAGLRLSNRMRARYPEEMTIILQHQFWDLGVTEHAFEVGLSFSNVPERLLVPFAAITSFVDPSVQFGLKFEVKDAETEGANDENGGGEPPEAEPVKATSGKRALAAVKADKTGTPNGDVPVVARVSPKSKPALVVAEKSGEEGAEPEPAEADGDAKKVISIDAFRKKP